jgi:membrane protein
MPVSDSETTRTRRGRIAVRVRAAQQTIRRHMPKPLHTAWRFWTKLTNDWVLNLAGLLAYNFILSLLPLLVLLLGVLGLVLRRISPESLVALQRTIAAALPAQGSQAIVADVSTRLQSSAGAVLVIGIVTSVIGGSRLFITLENCLGVVFRLRSRDPLRQNLMALGMLLLYLVLVPIVLAAFFAPAALVSLLPQRTPQLVSHGIVQLSGGLVSLLAALVLFGVIYVVVPNRPFRWHTVWRGALVAAVLLVGYEALFPLYATVFLRPGNYGSLAGFAIVILVFFYYLAFILLLGAEINSWAVGQREMAADIPGVLHEVQAHNTTRGAAGPTAGAPYEDLQHYKGAAAMETVTAALEHERRDHGISIPRRLWKRWLQRRHAHGASRAEATAPDERP